MANAMQEALLKAKLVTEEEAVKAEKERIKEGKKITVDVRGQTKDLLMLDDSWEEEDDG